MKNFILFIVVLFASLNLNAQGLPLDFELPSEDYTFTTFGDAVFAVAADPDDAGNNALKMTRPASTNWWSGGTIALDVPVDATTGAFSMDVYSSIALGYVELKLEQIPGVETIMSTTHGGTGWETLTFDTSTGAINGTPSAAVIVVVTPRITNDGGVATNPVSEEIYYFDNIQSAGGGGGDPSIELPLDFELVGVDYLREVFGGGSAVVAADPEDAGNKVLQFDRPVGANWWSGGVIDLDAPVDASTGTFTMDLYSTIELGYVELKFEQGADNISMSATHGGTGWETLTFDTSTGTMAGTPSAATVLVFTPRITNSEPTAANPTVAEVYYIDNIEVGAGGGDPSIELPLDFEVVGIDYLREVFGGGSAVVAADPEDAGNKVLQFDRPVGANWWSGGVIDLDAPVDASTGTFTMDLYSTIELGYVELKFEQGADNISMSATHGGTGWETLTFDTSTGTMAGTPSAATVLVFTPRITNSEPPAANPTVAEVYYIDNIEVGAGGGGGGTTPNGSELVINGGFEEGPGQTAWEFLDQGGSVSITDTDKRDGTYSALIVADVAGNGGAASFPVLNQLVFGENEVAPGDKIRVTFNVKAISGTAAPVYKAALFSNFTGSGAFRHDITFPAITGEWQTVTADITTNGALDPANGLGIQFQADCGANPDCSAEVYIDNVSAFVLGDIDTARPVITLNGDNPFELETGTPFVEPGFTASDNVDGNLTASVVVSGDVVDENVEGSYEIRYNVSDAEGNKAIEMTRIVNVGEGGGGVDVGPSLIPNGGFEDGVAQTDWEFLANNGTIEIIDTDKNGGTYSAKLVADVPGTTASNPIIQQEGFALNEVNPGDVVRVSFDVKALVTQPGADVKAALLSNRANGAGATRYDISFTPTGAWQSVTQDITIDNLFVSANGLSIQFEAGCGGVTGCNIEMYVDNVSVSLVGGGVDPGSVELPIDFELPSEDYTFATFGSAVFAIATDPEDAGNNVLKMTRPAGTNWWSGGTISLEVPIDATTGAFTMDVYSSIALGYVELKLEQTPGVETIMSTTHGGTGWETLTFDTSTGAINGVPSAAALVVVTPRITNSEPPATNPVAEEIYYFDNIQVAGGVDPDPNCESGLTGNTPGVDYVLVWADEFDAEGAVCSENWFHQTQLPAGGSWFNGELQHYTDRLDNSFVADGNLNIVAKKESFTDQGETKEYTSARLNSKYAFTYGRVDVRAILPSGDGTWPAIWTLGRNINEPGGYWHDEFGELNWPAPGEIDIMEHGLQADGVILGSTHTPSGFGGASNTGSTTVSDYNTAYHVYSIIWDAEKIDFLIDDVVFHTYNPEVKNADTWPFDSPQYLLLNVAMGGVAGTIDPLFTESSMVIDYVRVYQQNPGADATLSDLLVDGETIEGFDSDIINYIVELPSGTELVPTVMAATTNNAASAVVTPASSIPGTTEIVVTSEDMSATKTYFVEFIEATGTDATLSDLQVDGTTIAGFDANTLNYSVQVPKGTTSVPVVTVITNDASASAVVTPAGSIPGTTEIVVTSGDASVSKTYNVEFTEVAGSDATLSDLKINGTTVSGFSADILTYAAELPSGTTTVPTVSFTTSDAAATTEITAASALPGTTSILVTSEDALDTKTYTISFTVADKQDQLIEFQDIENISLAAESIELTAEASSGLAVIFSSSSDKIELVESSATLLSPGRVSIVALQAGNASFEAAPSVEQSFCINPLKPVITANVESDEVIILTSSSSVGNQWYVNGTLISGATANTFETTEIGNYTVKVRVDDCVSPLSDELSLVVTGFNQLASGINIYPNPVQGVLQLTGIKGEIINYQFFDASGRNVPVQLVEGEGVYRADISNLNNGIYLLKVNVNDQSLQFRIVKE
ncbi:family 16 glycosylhydrolase [Fulvivirga sp.]|uniref:immunoglobulin-like domain-containing protein n=3 Tax=Fulvivirga sp. TaxID=1931237 RepID=UPI0032EB86D9